ncbi:MAG: hypothetical protein J2O39_06470 [Acidimicrobiales bacterium]|nr:hypothetical protein [Acidimicrobiales bacterium]MBO0894002.1 hypothetical protein [Acidimicrobiales bacterium]
MQFSKQEILNLLHSSGQSQQAEQAAQELPDQVDHEGHAGLLQKFGINPSELLGKLGGGGGQQPT